MYRKFISRIERIDALIHRKGTGTAQELAEKLGVSRRTVLEYLTLMKEKGAPIYFDRNRKTYCYSAEGNFKFLFTTVQ